jgi:hypothetical protein
MPDLISVSFYTRTDDDLYQAERLRSFLTRLSEQGHYLAGSDSEAISAAWMVAHYKLSSRENPCSCAVN